MELLCVGQAWLYENDFVQSSGFVLLTSQMPASARVYWWIFLLPDLIASILRWSARASLASCLSFWATSWPYALSPWSIQLLLHRYNLVVMTNDACSENILMWLETIHQLTHPPLGIFLDEWHFLVALNNCLRCLHPSFIGHVSVLIEEDGWSWSTSIFHEKFVGKAFMPTFIWATLQYEDCWACAPTWGACAYNGDWLTTIMQMNIMLCLVPWSNNHHIVPITHDMHISSKQITKCSNTSPKVFPDILHFPRSISRSSS